MQVVVEKKSSGRCGRLSPFDKRRRTLCDICKCDSLLGNKLVKDIRTKSIPRVLCDASNTSSAASRVCQISVKNTGLPLKKRGYYQKVHIPSNDIRRSSRVRRPTEKGLAFDKFCTNVLCVFIL
jgi:hypothetical protein